MALPWLELLHGRPQHDLVDVYVVWLLNGVGNGAGDGVRRNRLLIEVLYGVGALLMRAAKLEFGVHCTRQDGGGANCPAHFVTQALR